jgi:hypothetical protein
VAVLLGQRKYMARLVSPALHTSLIPRIYPKARPGRGPPLLHCPFDIAGDFNFDFKNLLQLQSRDEKRGSHVTRRGVAT